MRRKPVLGKSWGGFGRRVRGWGDLGGGGGRGGGGLTGTEVVEEPHAATSCELGQAWGNGAVPSHIELQWNCGTAALRGGAMSRILGEYRGPNAP